MMYFSNPKYVVQYKKGYTENRYAAYKVFGNLEDAAKFAEKKDGRMFEIGSELEYKVSWEKKGKIKAPLGKKVTGDAELF